VSGSAGTDLEWLQVAELNSTPDWMILLQALLLSLVSTIALTSAVPLVVTLKGKVSRMKLKVSLQASWKAIASAAVSVAGVLWSAAGSG
jgi:hypothetical protein